MNRWKNNPGRGFLDYFKGPVDEWVEKPRLIYRTVCCRKLICNTCYLDGLGYNIWKDFWYNEQDSFYITCPIQSCSTPWAYRDFNEFERRIRALAITNISYDERRLNFCRVFNYRERLEHYLPDMTMAQWHVTARWRVARGLHRDLERLGVMRVQPDQAAWNDHPFVHRPFVYSRIDVPGLRMISVPFAMGKLALGPSSKTCVCCYAEHLTPKVPEEVIRQAVGTGWLYRGTWIWMISMFPSPSDFAACASRHQLDTCRDCLTEHFTSRLQTLGTASCDAFMCPEPGCGHVYSLRQVGILAVMVPDLQLDKDPMFRWCLRPGCDAGQSYDTRICETSLPECNSLMSWTRKVWCHACSFEMCYHHQTPWHHGQTCEEYDNAAGRHEDDRTTNQWLADHTKRCPSCNSAVQKNGGCFHMDCGKCSAQFCWLCLADWGNIERLNRRGSVVYDPLGHKPGCFFRDSLSRPHHLIGDNQQDAQRQHRQNMFLGLLEE